VQMSTEMPPDRGRILVDVSETVGFNLRTGIQRVVRELLAHGLAGAAPRPVVPVMASGRHFHELSEAGWARLHSAGGGGASGRASTNQSALRARVVQAMKRAAQATPALYNRLQRTYNDALFERRSAALHKAEPIRIGPGDRILLADSFWGGAPTLKAAEQAKADGAQVTLIAYDLIPFSHPQFCDARLVANYQPLMSRAVALSGQVFAISEDCASAFRAQFPAARVSAFRLGHDISKSHARSTDEFAWPTNLWAGPGRVFVIVGSIEPRKGHRVVLEAFERRWARGEPDKLLIIGKVGWQVDDLVARIDRHDQSGRRLFHLHNASDAMLKEALERAHAGIIASYIEGFGLPLAESLAAGLPMLASDIRVFHEIAAEAALYFAPGDPAALDEAVDLLHRRHAEMVRAAAEFVWPDWREAAEDFYAVVEKQAASAPD